MGNNLENAVALIWGLRDWVDYMTEDGSEELACEKFINEGIEFRLDFDTAVKMVQKHDEMLLKEAAERAVEWWAGTSTQLTDGMRILLSNELRDTIIGDK